MYRLFFWLVLRHLPAEWVHHTSFALLRGLMAVPGVRALCRRWLGPRTPVRAMGLDFPGPLGLAAGFDKNAVGVTAMAALGFGFVEIGTVTAQPQPGNPRPRLFRLPADRALVNRLGFNNEGCEAVARRLERLDRRGIIVGVNIGKTKVVPDSEADADYELSARRLGPLADYMVVNVSSPNTPGLRDLQTVSRLRPLLERVRRALDEVAPKRVPLLVKIAPDLADDDVDAVCDLALELGLDGIVATNTTIGRDGLRSTDVPQGGLSGAPLKARALAVISRLAARANGKLTLVAVGGIETAADAQARLDAGAHLVQAYTGFVYGGPLWPRRVQSSICMPISTTRLGGMLK
jgi:dihydroorotate dehydrogenase